LYIWKENKILYSILFKRGAKKRKKEGKLRSVFFLKRQNKPYKKEKNEKGKKRLRKGVEGRRMD
jgi:hypothetical protein